jgi:hypothetical protein
MTLIIPVSTSTSDNVRSRKSEASVVELKRFPSGARVHG